MVKSELSGRHIKKTPYVNQALVPTSRQCLPCKFSVEGIEADARAKRFVQMVPTISEEVSKKIQFVSFKRITFWRSIVSIPLLVLEMRTFIVSLISFTLFKVWLGSYFEFVISRTVRQSSKKAKRIITVLSRIPLSFFNTRVPDH